MADQQRISGAVAAGAALAAGELAAGLIASLPSLLSGVAVAVIDSVPRPVKEFAIETFGTKDKLALGVGIVVVSLLVGYLLGPRMIKSPSVAWAVFGTFGIVGAAAAARSPQVGSTSALATGAISALFGLLALAFLARAAQPTEEGRRRFLVSAGALVALAVVAAYGGSLLADRTRRLFARREDVILPEAVEVATVPAGSSLEVSGLTPLVTPNDDFYRIDTVPFTVPSVDLDTWAVRIHGMVSREVEYTYADLAEMDLVERHVTLTCVSNEVGGDLIGTAKWLGVPLATLLDVAGFEAGAEQIIGRSVDGFTVGFPVDAAYDGREALVAIGMNGEPLPFDHGFPARLVVAGLYGYVSATKWLSEIELTTWEAFDAYWIPRGWSKEAPIKTQSRVDVPRHGSRVAAGPQAIAGVAWAPNRGISRVEVEVDGEWLDAELAVSLSEDTWRQWRLVHDLAPGSHTLRVRATDITGAVQDSEFRPPAPDGATGFHTVTVQAS